LQAQVNAPGVFVQTAFASQLSVPRVHSSASVQVTPLPVYPGLHPQVKLPGVFVHVAVAAHPPLFAAHSFTSVQVTPLPV
jgi:hypothetical protein